MILFLHVRKLAIFFTLYNVQRRLNKGNNYWARHQWARSTKRCGLLAYSLSPGCSTLSHIQELKVAKERISHYYSILQTFVMQAWNWTNLGLAPHWMNMHPSPQFCPANIQPFTNNTTKRKGHCSALHHVQSYKQVANETTLSPASYLKITPWIYILFNSI